jgi:hypothetical protein
VNRAEVVGQIVSILEVHSVYQGYQVQGSFSEFNKDTKLLVLASRKLVEGKDINRKVNLILRQGSRPTEVLERGT